MMLIPQGRRKRPFMMDVAFSCLLLMALPKCSRSFQPTTASLAKKQDIAVSLNMVPQRKILLFVPESEETQKKLSYAERTSLQGTIAIASIAATSGFHLNVNGVPVTESLLALLSGMVIVSGVTDAVERMTAHDVPPFDPSSGQGRFDQNTFGGRFCQLLLACDPRLLLYTKEEVQQYKELIENHSLSESASDHELWETKRIVDSALHSETKEWIPRPFRMSGYLPFNGPICIAMLMAQSSTSLLFWSWINQSQNAMVNFHNRNASSEMSNETLLQSYLVAVVTALSVAFGLGHVVTANYTGEEAVELLRFISFPSAVIASSLNCFIVRSPEMDTGVPLYIIKQQDDDNQKELRPVLPNETSQIAATKGVYSTTASRAVLQIPTYFIPPLLLDTVGPLKHLLVDHPHLTAPVTTFLLLLSFGLGLPCAVGLFPQMSTIDAKNVEPKYQELGYKEFYFNKGL